MALTRIIWKKPAYNFPHAWIPYRPGQRFAQRVNVELGVLLLPSPPLPKIPPSAAIDDDLRACATAWNLPTAGWISDFRNLNPTSRPAMRGVPSIT